VTSPLCHLTLRSDPTFGPSGSNRVSVCGVTTTIAGGHDGTSPRGCNLLSETTCPECRALAEEEEPVRASYPLFATPGLAHSHALRLACRNSADGQACTVDHTRALRGNDGTGPAYIVVPCTCGSSCPDYRVLEITDSELRSLVRVGMLREAEDADERASEIEGEVADLRISGKMPRRCERLRTEAEQLRDKADRLRVAAVGMQLVNATAAAAEADLEPQDIRRAV